MFKRVEKRQLKRVKEQELGLDEELKQVLGLQDTDSDESFDSSSDSDSEKSDMDTDMSEENGDDVSVGDEVRNASRKRKRSIEPHRDHESFEASNEGVFTSSHLFTATDSMDYEDDPPMGVLAATTKPIYDIPESQGTHACILCPGKLLKNTKMVTVHVESTAHLRRLQRYKAQVSKLTSTPAGLDTDDPRVVLREMGLILNPAGASQSRADSSKRSQRRNIWKSKQTERRMVRRRAKAEKSGVNGKVESASLDEDGSSEVSRKERKPKNFAEKGDSDSEIVPASSTIHPPAPTAGKTLQDQNGGSVRKKRRAPVAETCRTDHPAKRRKGASSSTAPSSTAPGADGNLVVKSHSKKGDSNPSKMNPTLKTPQLSRYFTVDNTRPGPLVKRRKSIRGTTKNEARKRTKSIKPGSQSRKDHIQTSLQKRYKKDASKGRGNDAEKSRRRSRINSQPSKAKGTTQKPWSAEQWGRVKDLKIFD